MSGRPGRTFDNAGSHHSCFAHHDESLGGRLSTQLPMSSGGGPIGVCPSTGLDGAQWPAPPSGASCPKVFALVGFQRNAAATATVHRLSPLRGPRRSQCSNQHILFLAVPVLQLFFSFLTFVPLVFFGALDRDSSLSLLLAHFDLLLLQPLLQLPLQLLPLYSPSQHHQHPPTNLQNVWPSVSPVTNVHDFCSSPFDLVLHADRL